MSDVAICEMSVDDIEKELSVRHFELFDNTLDKTYRAWIYARICALKFELEERQIEI